MNRNISKNALVLSVKATAQDNRSVCVLTKDGIEYATLFGGPKSKLCSAVSPWNFGTMYFYNKSNSQVNIAEAQFAKITDFDVKKYHPTFRENLFKSFAAALAGEIVLKSNCAGNGESAFVLLNGFLDGMDLCDEEKSRLGLLRFLWRYLDLLGVRPATERCARCGKKFDFESLSTRNSCKDALQYRVGGNIINESVLYSPTEGGFVCTDCVPCKVESVLEKGTRLSVSSLFYLDMAGIWRSENMATARSLSLSNDDYNRLKTFLYETTENALGMKLKTLVSGSGIL